MCVFQDTPAQAYEKLADLAHSSAGVEKKAFLDLFVTARSKLSATLTWPHSA